MANNSGVAFSCLFSIVLIQTSWLLNSADQDPHFFPHDFPIKALIIMIIMIMVIHIIRMRLRNLIYWTSDGFVV